MWEVGESIGNDIVVWCDVRRRRFWLFDVDELIEFLLEELALNIGTVLLVAAEVPLMMESVSGGIRMVLLALACDALGSA